MIVTDLKANANKMINEWMDNNIENVENILTFMTILNGLTTLNKVCDPVTENIQELEEVDLEEENVEETPLRFMSGKSPDEAEVIFNFDLRIDSLRKYNIDRMNELAQEFRKIEDESEEEEAEETDQESDSDEEYESDDEDTDQESDSDEEYESDDEENVEQIDESEEEDDDETDQESDNDESGDESEDESDDDSDETMWSVDASIGMEAKIPIKYTYKWTDNKLLKPRKHASNTYKWTDNKLLKPREHASTTYTWTANKLM